MRYMGSKARIAKDILPIILANRKEGQWYVEPFVGGANLIDKVGGNRIGADVHYYLIEALKLIRDNPESIPELITEDMHRESRIAGTYPPGLQGFIGFAMSFGGTWVGGYRRDVAGSKGCPVNMASQTRTARNSVIKQSPALQGVEFIHASYDALAIPPESLIYCDPPYAGTEAYKGTAPFDHARFWEWCRCMTLCGHTIFVSESNAPEDFECIWQKALRCNIHHGAPTPPRVERLFTLKDF